MAEKLQSICCASFGQLTRSVNPDMKKDSIHYILSLSQTNGFQSTVWRLFSWLFFHRTLWQMILEYKLIPICTTICMWWGPSVHWNFLRGLQLKRAEKNLCSRLFNFARRVGIRCRWLLESCLLPTVLALRTAPEALQFAHVIRNWMRICNTPRRCKVPKGEWTFFWLDSGEKSAKVYMQTHQH